MTGHERRIHRALSLALTAGVALSGCSAGPCDSDEADVGTTTADLQTVCEAGWLGYLDYVLLEHPVEYLALRRTAVPRARGADMYERGIPCATAADASACQARLDDTWPTAGGWGEGMHVGLVTTCGDTVSRHDSPREVAKLLGAIDSPADALLVAYTHNHHPHCDTVVETAQGSWRMRAGVWFGDCPVMEEVWEVEVRRNGRFKVLEFVEEVSTGVCVGRRPDGMRPQPPVAGTAVARHVARLAWLEAAAVVAFQRLAADLRRLGAPEALVRRALAAAEDEVDHAERMTAFAERCGVGVPPVEVGPHVERSAVEVALENAVEGCVRETYGVVEARYRSQHAQSAELRALFAKIAGDEARHAALSWEVASWLDGRLTDEERARVQAAAERAHADLAEELRVGRPDEVQRRLGAPSPRAAVAMAETLRMELAPV